MKANGKVKRIELGRFIVADPPFARQADLQGTRIMVWQVFEHLALGGR